MASDPPAGGASSSDGLAEALKTLRKRARLTQPQAAEKVGVSDVTYQRYERGERELTLRQAEDWARALGFAWEDMFAEWRALREGALPTPTPAPRPREAAGLAETPTPPYLVDIWSRSRPGTSAPIVYDASQPTAQLDLGWMFGGHAGFLRVAGDSETGFVESGQTVAFDRSTWPRRGDGCVIETDDGEFYVKEFVRQEGPKVIVSQRFPKAEIEFELARLKGVYRIRAILD